MQYLEKKIKVSLKQTKIFYFSNDIIIKSKFNSLNLISINLAYTPGHKCLSYFVNKILLNDYNV